MSCGSPSAAAHGAVTPESLREADQRLRRKMRRHRRLFANPSRWDAIAVLGTIGLGVESVCATVHPFAAGSVAGVASRAVVAASGVTGGWIARNFGTSSRQEQMDDQISNDAAEELRRLGEQVALEVLERAEANLAPGDEARSVTKEDVLMAWSEMIPRPGLIIRFVAWTLSLTAIIVIAFELAAKYLATATAVLMLALVGTFLVFTRFGIRRIASKGARSASRRQTRRTRDGDF